jgi:uncharacterized protein (DUF305 family)
MKKPLVAVVAVLAAVVIAVTASAVTIAVRDDGTGRDSGSMMSTGAGNGSASGDRPGGWMFGMGSGQMMAGTVARDEFSYLTHMVAHHEEAVEAAAELARSQRPEMQEFGESIIASQSAQIDQMEAWLAAWYPDRSTDVDYEPMMRDLTELSGDELDQAFLQDMLMHHMMAVMSSQQLLMRGDTEHPQVERLAQSISEEQRAEILQMQRWLTNWYGED